MAWSIFSSYDQGNALATIWATELLGALGIPATPARIQFIYDWEKSEGGGGEYNPLNQGDVPGAPQLTSTGSQYGGGAANFVSWAAGIQGAAAYLHMPNFQGILGAIQGGDYNAMQSAVIASPWAASHYGGGSAWATEQYQAMSPAQMAQIAATVGLGSVSAASVPADTGVGVGASTSGVGATANAAIPSVPGMNDIPALKQYIQQNDPTYAWLLSVPEVSTAFMEGIAAGDSIQQIVAALQQTAWWKSTTTAYRTFLSNYYSSPNDYNFNSQGSTAQGMQSQVEATAATNGVTLNKVQAQTIAIDALKYGWNSQQIQAAIGSQVYVQGAQGATSDAGTVVQQLQSQAGQYLMDPNDPVLQSWAQNIAGGTQTMAQFDAYLKQWASTKWSGMAGQIRNGNTPQQIVSPLQSSIANTLEIAPAQVDFINNPQFGKILDYVPPNSTTGVHQIMTNSQAQQYVKQDAALGYGNTQGARDNAAQLEQAIVQNFGKVGS